MAQHPIEVILTRQLAEYLSMAIFVVDPTGDLLYYNEPAERILGARFEETGPMPESVWTRVFDPTDAAGNPIPPDELPLVRALKYQRPQTKRLGIVGLDGVRRQIEIGAWPLSGHGDRNLGAVAMLWEVDEP